METLTHVLVALPLAVVCVWLAFRSPSRRRRIIGIALGAVAFFVVFLGSYSVFCTSCT